MSNSTNVETIPVSVKLTFVLPSIVFFCAFLYFITIIIRVYYNTPHVRDTPRYILFFHMLMYDTLFLLLGFLLLIAAEFSVSMLLSICFILVTIAELTYLITPFILAVMSLERYISVCFPLRHVELWTAQRSNAAVGTLWMLCLTIKAVDFYFLSKSVKSYFFDRYVICSRQVFFVGPVQELVALIKTMLSLTLVALVIIYTYISIIIVALKVSSGKSSGLKASKTVLLHAFQLLLYIVSFLSALVKNQLDKIKLGTLFIDFIVFTCFPRFLGPLLYGLRDETFRKCMQRTLGIGQFKTSFKKKILN